LPDRFAINTGRFFIQLASEPDQPRVLYIIAHERKPGQIVHIGVIDPISPYIETAEEVCGRILKAASHLGIENLRSTDDCGFSPFSDDVSTARKTAFAKIQARIGGAKFAETRLS